MDYDGFKSKRQLLRKKIKRKIKSMQNATRMLLKNGFSQQHFIHLAFLMLKPSHRVLILTNFTLTKHLDR